MLGFIPVLGSLLSQFLAIIFGGMGGAIAVWLGIPGGWLIGALVAAFLIGLTRLRLTISRELRSITMGFAGLTVGAAISKETLQNAAILPWSMALMCIFLVLVVGFSYHLHRRLWKASPGTAISCVWPGNVMLAFAGAEALKADMDRVTFVQTTRLLALVVVLPLIAGGTNGGTDADAAYTWPLLAAIALAAICSLIAYRLKMVGGELFLSAGAVGILVAVFDTPVPIPLVATNLFQVVVGAYIGLALAGCRWTAMRQAVVPAVVSSGIAALLTALAAFPIAWWLDYPVAALALSFAPGGAEAMILLAAAFNVDPGFVGLHHTIRLIGLTLLFPLILRLFASSIYQVTGSR